MQVLNASHKKSLFTPMWINDSDMCGRDLETFLDSQTGLNYSRLTHNIKSNPLGVVYKSRDKIFSRPVCEH